MVRSSVRMPAGLLFVYQIKPAGSRSNFSTCSNPPDETNHSVKITYESIRGAFNEPSFMSGAMEIIFLMELFSIQPRRVNGPLKTGNVPQMTKVLRSFTAFVKTLKIKLILSPLLFNKFKHFFKAIFPIVLSSHSSTSAWTCLESILGSASDTFTHNWKSSLSLVSIFGLI